MRHPSYFWKKLISNLIVKASLIFLVRILQEGKFLGSCSDLRKILQISCTILMLRIVQQMSRFGQDSEGFLKIF
jgi:hypothetical protein